MPRAALAALAAALALTACDGADEAATGAGMPGDEAATPRGDPAAGTEGTPVPDVPADPEVVGAPDSEIGAHAAIEPAVFEGAAAVVAVGGITVYSSGAVVEIAVRTHPDAGDPAQAPGDDPMGMMGGGQPEQAADDLLYVEIRYPDGRSASTLDDPGEGGRAGGSDDPSLTHSTSQGTPGAWDYDLWLEPLPELGDEPIEVVVEWPEEGIEQASVELDADAIEEAAGRVVELWPAQDPGQR